MTAEVAAAAPEAGLWGPADAVAAVSAGAFAGTFAVATAAEVAEASVA
jgi:hypothetical protein